MGSLRLHLAVLAALSLAVPALAREPAATGPGGVFDYYLLSLSLAPSFCALSAANRAQDECRTLTEGDFEKTPLTVHGLWPNRAHVSVNLQPHDCPGPPFDVPPSVQLDLRRYMPGGPALERHEWRKHGTCSGEAPWVYFAAIVSLARQANETIGAVLRDRGMLGQTVRVTDLLSAVAARDPATAAAIVVDCRQPGGGGEFLIDEIRLVLSKDLRPMSASGVGLGQNSGCPRGGGRIPRVTR
jgi:ribonuclease T2